MVLVFLGNLILILRHSSLGRDGCPFWAASRAFGLGGFAINSFCMHLEVLYYATLYGILDFHKIFVGHISSFISRWNGELYAANTEVQSLYNVAGLLACCIQISHFNTRPVCMCRQSRHFEVYPVDFG